MESREGLTIDPRCLSVRPNAFNHNVKYPFEMKYSFTLKTWPDMLNAVVPTERQRVVTKFTM